MHYVNPHSSVKCLCHHQKRDMQTPVVVICRCCGLDKGGAQTQGVALPHDLCGRGCQHSPGTLTAHGHRDSEQQG